MQDQHGRAVPLPREERANLCAALSLHTLGKKLLRGEVTPAAPPPAAAHEPAAGGSGAQAQAAGGEAQALAYAAAGADCARVAEQQRFGEALSVLLEADAAWGHVGDAWKQRVDNYGMLQLDITWALLNLVCSRL